MSEKVCLRIYLLIIGIVHCLVQRNDEIPKIHVLMDSAFFTFNRTKQVNFPL